MKDLTIRFLKEEYQEAKQQGDEEKAEQLLEELHSLQNGILGKILDKVPTIKQI